MFLLVTLKTLMKKTLFLSLIISLKLSAQNCMISLEALDFLEYEYSAVQLGYKGPVKHIERFHETQKENGDFEIIHGVWGDHYFIDRLNFNEQGNLTSMYQEDNSGDTMVVIQIEYDKQHRILRVAEHEMDIWKKHEPFKGENWSTRTLHYTYCAEGIASILAIGNWHLGNYGDTCQVDYIYEGSRLVQKKTFKVGRYKTLLSTRQFVYNSNDGRLKQMVVGIDTLGHSKGVYSYNYQMKSGGLSSKVFSTENTDEWEREGTWYFDEDNNLKSYESGDTLQESWYCFKALSYDEFNNVASEYSNSEYDGRDRKETIYNYIYDDKNNWVIKNIRTQNQIDFDDETERVDVYRRTQNITYYKL